MAPDLHRRRPPRLGLTVDTTYTRLWEPARTAGSGTALHTTIPYGRWRRVRLLRPRYTTRSHPMEMRIRPSEPGDYARLAEIQNRAMPMDQESEEELRHRDATWEHDKYERQRWVAEVDGAGVVGWAVVSHLPHYHDPKRYLVFGNVDPAHQRRGVGSRLYEHCLAHVRSRGAEVARSYTVESLAGSVAFLAQRGFVEVQRDWESRLDVTTFDFARFAGADTRLAGTGVTIVTLADEMAQDQGARRRAYELFDTCERDVPAPDPYIGASFQRFVADEVENPRALLDAFFLAKDGDRYVGVSNLGRSLVEPGVIQQGLTGVLPEYRGRGIAMALKVRTIRYAADHGYREIRTGNAVTNREMLRINDALGFVRQPPWIEFDKDLKENG